MNKFDNDVQNHLTNFEYDYSPDYWDVMEQKLDEAGSNAKGGLSGSTGRAGLGSWASLFIYSSILSVVVTTAYFGFGLYNSNDINELPSIGNYDATNSSFDLSVTDETTLQLVETEKQVAEAQPSTIVRKQLITAKEDVEMMVDVKLTQPFVHLLPNALEAPEVAEADSHSAKAHVQDQNFVIPDPQYLNEDNRTDTVSKTKVRVVTKVEEDKKPMQKPKKRVFGKNKGLLHWLGLR